LTESEWLACTDPEKMLKSIRDSNKTSASGYFRGLFGVLLEPLRRRKASERKRRLFGCACCRHIWHLVPDERSREALLVAERFADGLAGEIELKTAGQEARIAYEQYMGGLREQYVATVACSGVVMKNVGHVVNAMHIAALAVRMVCGSWDAERAFQCSLILDLFGNTFRPSLPLPPAVLAWHDAVVVRLAQAAYDERHLPSGTLDNSRLAVLADALEEGGCTDADILGHLRGPGPHVRGCWSVDLCLGKS
jgi:hypothetical protein